jgi:LysM repeat protein
MINKWLLVFLCVLSIRPGQAQSNDLQVLGVAPNLYIIHTVQAKENWYSVGRMYNVSPKQLAPYNKLSMDKPLSIGQVVKVPLTAENFSQDGHKSADEVFIPVRHTLQEKEWLYRVSVNYNKVPIESLEKWNGINKDQAKAGLKLIVGYLKVKNGQSSLATGGESKIPSGNTVAATTTPEIKKPEEKKAETKSEARPVPTTPAVENTDAAKNNTAKDEVKPVVTPVVNTGTTTEARLSYFRSQYEETGKSVSGNAGIFKSTSGWSDGKYYALVNNIPVGTIIKVNNPVSGKTIFAKVLGNLPDMKESLGLIARLSDAAAAQIGATGIKFSVELRY